MLVYRPSDIGSRVQEHISGFIFLIDADVPHPMTRIFLFVEKKFLKKNNNYCVSLLKKKKKQTNAQMIEFLKTPIILIV